MPPDLLEPAVTQSTTYFILGFALTVA